MIRKLLFCVALLCSMLHVQAQDSIRIEGQLMHNTRFSKVIVRKFNVGGFDIAAFPIVNEKFTIILPSIIQPGVYRLQYSQTTNEFIDVIINGKEKNISFSIDLLNQTDLRKPIFTQSQENQNWYDYQKQSQLQLQKISVLHQALALYPISTDKIVTQLQEAIVLEQDSFKYQKSAFLIDNKNTWAANMVANMPVYFTNPKDDWRVQDFEKRNHFWDGINTKQIELINTPLYTDLIIEYIKYYMNPEMNFSEEEMNDGFIKSVDTIINRFSGNSKTHEFAIKYLQMGFKEIGKEKVLQYIDEKYNDIASQCQDESEKSDFEKRMAGYEAIKSGATAPDIVLSNETTLYDIISDKILLVFWASWCPHCMKELPKLNDWAKNNVNCKVLAISLDDDRQSFTTTIQQFPNLIHSSDFKKWESKSVIDYFIHATPTFILLDKDKKIVDKYADFDSIPK